MKIRRRKHKNKMKENNPSYTYKTVPVFDAPEGSSMVAGIFERIETECIKPRSKWYFIFKNELFWGMGLLSILIGSVAVAASLFAFSYIELDYYTVTHDSLMGFLLDTLPLMWVCCFLIFIILGYLQIRQTKRGYRYSLVIIMGGTLVLSLLGGTVLHFYGFGALLEKAVGNRIPFHNSAFMERENIWQNAARGVIAGEVISIESDNSAFILKDWTGRPWLIQANDLLPMDVTILKENKIVRVIGLPAIVNMEPGVTNSMHACFILPWENNAKKSGQMEALHNTQSADVIDFNKKDVVAQNNINNSERNLSDSRSNECKGVGPYQLMQRLRAEAK